MVVFSWMYACISFISLSFFWVYSKLPQCKLLLTIFCKLCLLKLRVHDYCQIEFTFACLL